MEIGLTIKLKKKETKIKLFFFAKKKGSNNKDLKDQKNMILINNKKIDEYFKFHEMQDILQVLFFSEIYKHYTFDLFIYVRGGGIINQNKTIALSLKRLFKINENILNFNFINDNLYESFNNNAIKDEYIKSENFSKNRKKYINVDYRRKERKKYGLKKARKASQYHKR